MQRKTRAKTKDQEQQKTSLSVSTKDSKESKNQTPSSKKRGGRSEGNQKGQEGQLKDSKSEVHGNINYQNYGIRLCNFIDSKGENHFLRCFYFLCTTIVLIMVVIYIHDYLVDLLLVKPKYSVSLSSSVERCWIYPISSDFFSSFDSAVENITKKHNDEIIIYNLDFFLSIFLDKSNLKYALCLALLVYYLFLFLSRFLVEGFNIVYEMYWACNYTMLITCLGLFTNRPFLIHAACISVSIDQLLWYIDVSSYFMINKFIIGVAKYITWEQTGIIKKFTSTHHLWFLPLCLYIGLNISYKSDFTCTNDEEVTDTTNNNIKKDYHTYAFHDYMLISYLLSTIFVTCLNIFSRIFTPFTLPNGRYMNVNLVYELWKDIPDKWQLSHSNPMIQLFRLCILWNLLNLPCVFVLFCLSRGLEILLGYF